MEDQQLTPQQRARAAGYQQFGFDLNTFLSRDRQRVMSAEQVREELNRIDANEDKPKGE
jgi:hypothetical protein